MSTKTSVTDQAFKDGVKTLTDGLMMRLANTHNVTAASMVMNGMPESAIAFAKNSHEIRRLNAELDKTFRMAHKVPVTYDHISEPCDEAWSEHEELRKAFQDNLIALGIPPHAADLEITRFSADVDSLLSKGRSAA